MRLKLYRAANMADAMAGVRAELGPEALILGSRRVAGGVEVTAALEPAEPPVAATGPPPDDDALAYHGIPSALRVRLGGTALEPALARLFRFEALPLAPGGPPVQFIGPPGSGKTLTVARLATRLVMANTLPMVITADGKRAGGAEQLAAFTRLLGIELIAASHPVALGRAIAARRPGSPVLIDSPGTDPFDAGEREEVAALASAAGAVVVLVMAGGVHPEEAAETAAAFGSVDARWLVATRLDQTRRLGGVLAAAHAAKLAFTEAGIGARAADGLVPMTPRFLADRLSGTGAPRTQEGGR